MRTVIRLVWFGGAGVLAAMIVLTLVSVVASVLDVGGPSLAGDARFFAALLAPPLSLCALLAIGCGAVGLRLLPEDERALGRRSLVAGSLAFVASLLWMVLSIGLLGGGIIPH